MLAADIFLIATPTWMGHMSSVAQRVLERIDAELSDTDDAGQMRTYGKVAAAVVVGNEDGAARTRSARTCSRPSMTSGSASRPVR